MGTLKLENMTKDYSLYIYDVPVVYIQPGIKYEQIEIQSPLEFSKTNPLLPQKVGEAYWEGLYKGEVGWHVGLNQTAKVKLGIRNLKNNEVQEETIDIKLEIIPITLKSGCILNAKVTAVGSDYRLVHHASMRAVNIVVDEGA